MKTYTFRLEMSDGGERKMLKIAFLNMKIWIPIEKQ